MAKKVIATLKSDKENKLVKLIRCTRSKKTNAYTFKEELLTSDQAKAMLAAKQ
jgi:hypothetical protein